MGPISTYTGQVAIVPALLCQIFYDACKDIMQSTLYIAHVIYGQITIDSETDPYKKWKQSND